MAEPTGSVPAAMDSVLTTAPAPASGVTVDDAKVLKDTVDRLDKLERSTVVRINEWALTQEYEAVPLTGLTKDSEPQPQVVLKATNVTTGEGEILVPPAATVEWVAYIEALVEAQAAKIATLQSQVLSLQTRMSAAESDINSLESDVNAVERDVRSCNC